MIMGSVTLDFSQYASAGLTAKNFVNWSIIKYEKSYITEDNTDTLGLFRSVITDKHGSVVCYSPPKSIPTGVWFSRYPDISRVIVEEFVEGTMINAFWDTTSEKWVIATKSNIGADCNYYVSTKFKDMFAECCSCCNFDLNELDKQLCYSFVMQHPLNRIVVNTLVPQLYLIRMYQIHQSTVVSVPIPSDIDNQLQEIQGFRNTTVRVPTRYTATKYEEVIRRFATMNHTPYNILGVVFRFGNEHCKIRNPTYLAVRLLRGNTPRIDYQYLWLRKNNQVDTFLRFYPEYIDSISQLRSTFQNFVSQLYSNYVDCFILKKNKLEYFSTIYQQHMKRIHYLYRHTLKPANSKVTINIVRAHFDTLDIPLQLHSINKSKWDTILEPSTQTGPEYV